MIKEMRKKKQSFWNTDLLNFPEWLIEREHCYIFGFPEPERSEYLAYPAKEQACIQVMSSLAGMISAERQMAAFIPEALSLRYGKKNLLPEELGYPFQAVEICPRNIRFAEDLTHRDFLGAVLNLGIERSRTGDILLEEHRAYLFAQTEIAELVSRELSNVRHTPVKCRLTELEGVEYVPRTEAVRGTVSSVRLDSLLPLAFSSSRSRLSGLIEGAKVFVNGKLITSNGYQVKETDLISVRGMGKFRYIGTGGKTKKNRLSVEIERYI